MKPYCSFCRTESGPLIEAPRGEVAFICCDCAKSCILIFIDNFKGQKRTEKAAENG